MIEIPLTQGQIAFIDDEDYELVKNYKWRADWSFGMQAFYARAYFIVINEKYKHIRMHRLILGVTDPKIQVDHINHNTLDNRRSNLRICTASENQYNAGKRKDSTSGYKNVIWHKGAKKWIARITVSKKRLHLGLFSTPEEAYKAYCEAAIRYHGEFAHL